MFKSKLAEDSCYAYFNEARGFKKYVINRLLNPKMNIHHELIELLNNYPVKRSLIKTHYKILVKMIDIQELEPLIGFKGESYYENEMDYSGEKTPQVKYSFSEETVGNFKI